MMQYPNQCQYLSNHAPTPPLIQHQSIDNKLGFNVGLGEGFVGSCLDTDIDPSIVWTIWGPIQVLKFA